MTLRHCRQERAIIAAAHSDRWTGSLRQHAAGCSVCADVLLVERELRREAALSLDEARLPPSDILWYRSRLTVQQSALRPLYLVERWAFRLALACAATVAFGLFQAIVQQV
jgi:hypothetical protein